MFIEIYLYCDLFDQIEIYFIESQESLVVTIPESPIKLGAPHIERLKQISKMKSQSINQIQKRILVLSITGVPYIKNLNLFWHIPIEINLSA